MVNGGGHHSEEMQKKTETARMFGAWLQQNETDTQKRVAAGRKALLKLYH